MSVNFSKCLQPAVLAAAFQGTATILMGNGLPKIISYSTGSLIGITVGKYLSKKPSIGKEWEKPIKIIFTLATAFFASFTTFAFYSYFVENSLSQTALERFVYTRLLYSPIDLFALLSV